MSSPKTSLLERAEEFDASAPRACEVDTENLVQQYSSNPFMPMIIPEGIDLAQILKKSISPVRLPAAALYTRYCDFKSLVTMINESFDPVESFITQTVDTVSGGTMLVSEQGETAVQITIPVEVLKQAIISNCLNLITTRDKQFNLAPSDTTNLAATTVNALIDFSDLYSVVLYKLATQAQATVCPTLEVEDVFTILEDIMYDTIKKMGPGALLQNGMTTANIPLPEVKVFISNLFIALRSFSFTLLQELWADELYTIALIAAQAGKPVDSLTYSDIFNWLNQHPAVTNG
jgi:hypothetical protein